MENAPQAPATSPSSSQHPEQWGSRIGVILAVAGSAVGIGNFLRFPGEAVAHGGGAYMIPYFVSLLILGIPLGWAEWAMGRYGGRHGNRSAPSIYHYIWPSNVSLVFGAVGLIVPLVIYMYYVLIEAWCLAYAIYYINGALMLDNNPASYTNFFHNMIGHGADGAVFDKGLTIFLASVLITIVINFSLVYRGVSKGIETFCSFAMPLMFICGIVVLVRVLTFDTPLPDKPEQNLANALGYMWNPDFNALGNPATWLSAAGQILFTLGVGFGIIINYSSYLKKKDDIALSALSAASFNEISEVCMGGMITIPATFMFLGAITVTGGTFGVGFLTLPNVFAQMPAGQFFGFLWFFMLFLAAIASSISMLQPVKSFFEEGLGLKRNGSTALLACFAFTGIGFILYYSKDMKALDILDFWIGTFLIFVLALFQTLLYGWVFGIEAGEKELGYGAHLRVPRMVQYVLKYVTPAYLLIILALFCYYSMPDYIKAIQQSPIAKITACFGITVSASLLILVFIAHSRWKKQARVVNQEPVSVS